MEDVGLWQAYEAQASLQQALMYNAPDNHTRVADHACVPQSPFLPCWNDSSSSWLHAPRAQEIHDMSALISTPSLLVDTVCWNQQRRPALIQLDHSSPELSNMICGSDGLWGSHRSSSSCCSPATELYSTGASAMHKLMQVATHHSNMQRSTSKASNSLQSPGYNTLQATAGKGKGAASYGASSMREKISLQLPAAGTRTMDKSSSHFSTPAVPGMYATGTGRRDSCLDGSLLHPQQQLQLPIVPGITGAMNPCGSSTALGFTPTGSGVVAPTNAQEIQRRTGIAAGMRSMASFNPGPYVSSVPAAAAGERQDSALAARRIWLESKGGTTAPSTDFKAAQQLGGSVQRIAGSKQQQQPGGIKAAAAAAATTELPGIEWPSTMSPASAAVAVGAVLGSRHTGLASPVDEKTSIVMQPEAGTTTTTTTTTLKCALPRCPPASGNTVNSRKRSISQGDNSFQESFQDSGKKSAAGGMTWSGQDGCSRLEYLSTAAHKQVSQNTASGSRALGPALNTNLKPRARQGSANDPQSIAARVRRERISERLKYLQALIPNGDKLPRRWMMKKPQKLGLHFLQVDMVTMLEKAINYVQCLELQIQMLKDDSLWPKALGALPNTLQELLELAGPQFSGATMQSMKPDTVVECKLKRSVELMEEDPTNPPPPLIL